MARQLEAEKIARRFAAQLERAGWQVEIRPELWRGIPGLGGERWTWPEKRVYQVYAFRGVHEGVISFGWSTVTHGGPHTTRYLGGHAWNPQTRRDTRLRTIGDLQARIAVATRTDGNGGIL